MLVFPHLRNRGLNKKCACASQVRMFFAALLLAQTAAVLHRLWMVFPIVHEPVANLGQPEDLAFSDQLLIALAATLLHGRYWIRLWLVRLAPPRQSRLFAHVIYFAGRVSFFFGGAFFRPSFLNICLSWTRFPHMAKRCSRRFR